MRGFILALPIVWTVYLYTVAAITSGVTHAYLRRRHRGVMLWLQGEP